MQKFPKSFIVNLLVSLKLPVILTETSPHRDAETRLTSFTKVDNIIIHAWLHIASHIRSMAFRSDLYKFAN